MNEDFEEWWAGILGAWTEVAPSYVQADVQPIAGHMRGLWKRGATVAEFRQALEVAFASKAVTKRRALFYAYGVLRNWLTESGR
jgi:hypothetical protein